MFISDIDLYFSFYAVSLSELGMRIMVVSKNEFGSLQTPSASFLEQCQMDVY